MIELIQEALAIYNLPLTALLGMVLLYWMMVMIGMLDFDMDLFDFGDGGADAPDMSVEHPSSMGGAMLTAGRFLGFSQVPIAIWGSFFALFLWVLALYSNHRFNGVPGDRDLVTAAWLLVPCITASLLLTKLATLPLARLFAAMSGAATESQDVLGQPGVVTTTVLDDRHGQVEVTHDGAPALVNARLRPDGVPLQKGDGVRVTEMSPDGLFYYVEPVPVSSHILP
ncbi:MAG: hypothetical protein V4599_06185 [Verrucomicrobiota bacterium]